MISQNVKISLCIHVVLPIDSLLGHDENSTPCTSPSCCKLAPNGTLTLGAAHQLVDGNINIIPFTRLFGKLSLFRLWSRERSKQEVTSLKCTEGDLVTWWKDDWDTQFCAPLRDLSLHCGEQKKTSFTLTGMCFLQKSELFVSQPLTQVQYFLPHTVVTQQSVIHFTAVSVCQCNQAFNSFRLNIDPMSFCQGSKYRSRSVINNSKI